VNQATSTDVAVIGAGIIGLCAAERLRQEGYSVTLIERDQVAAGASAGNAASFALSEIVPMASPAIIRKSIKWLFDPTGPFSVVPGDMAKTAGWLLQFALSARRSVYDRSLETLAEHMQLERHSLPALLDRSGLNNMVRESGALYLYRRRRELMADMDNWKLRKAHGNDYEVFEGAALHSFQAGLSDAIAAAVFVPRYHVVNDPKDYCVALHDVISANGVVTLYGEVTALEPSQDGVLVHAADRPLLRADHVVVAAGPWSGNLARQLGDRIPLVGERGYNTTYPKAAYPELDKPMFFTSDGFVMAPLANGVRVGGASEIAALDRAPNYQRCRAMVKTATRLVPGLKPMHGVEWMGLRPTIPDTLPVIGHSAASNQVVYAFGHGHLGLTMASSTAQLVTELVSGTRLSIGLDAVSPRRF